VELNHGSTRPPVHPCCALAWQSWPSLAAPSTSCPPPPWPWPVWCRLCCGARWLSCCWRSQQHPQQLGAIHGTPAGSNPSGAHHSAVIFRRHFSRLSTNSSQAASTGRRRWGTAQAPAAPQDPNLDLFFDVLLDPAPHQPHLQQGDLCHPTSLRMGLVVGPPVPTVQESLRPCLACAA